MRIAEPRDTRQMKSAKSVRTEKLVKAAKIKTAAALIISLTAALSVFGCGEKMPPNEINAPEEVAGKVIGALGGTPSARLAGEMGEGVYYGSGEELLEALVEGTVDCVIMEGIAASELTADVSMIRILDDSLLEYDLSFAVPRENAELLTAVNASLTELRDNGTLQNLRDKYFSGKNYEYTPPEGVATIPGELTIAISADSPPFSYLNEDGEYAGLDIEIARAVCDCIGVELKIIEADESELITEVWFGRASLSAGWLPGDVDEQVSVSEPYADIAQVVIVRN